jgi:hypothetical protein
MSAASYELLETLQADIVALLTATPSLANVAIIADSDGETEARVTKALSGTIKNRANKYGHVIIVLAPEITQAEANLPGPPLLAKIEIQTLEHVQTNRGPSGTGLRSSGAAMLVLSTLHLANLGAHVIYADAKPLEPLPATTGLVSHAVTLYLRAGGINPIAKPLGVEAAISNTMTVSGTLSPNATGVLYERPPQFGSPMYSSDADSTFPYSYPRTYLYFDEAEPNWVLGRETALGVAEFWTGASADPTPDLVTTWEANPPFSTGIPVITAHSAIGLTCASPSSTIRYTTDGSFPSPAKTLYTTPLTGLSVGTVVRAAAYVAGMPPGDVLEFTVTE